jgi:E3 ubiquitin-protein ligase RNF146
MCRQEIPADFLERPQLVELVDHNEQKEAVAETDDSSHEEYQWFYEGRNGTSLYLYYYCFCFYSYLLMLNH